MRLFAQLSWYFRREWQRYLGAVGFLDANNAVASITVLSVETNNPLPLAVPQQRNAKVDTRL